MISMNIKSDDYATVGPGDYDTSPTIYLSDDQCEALGITGMPAPGTVFMLRVRAVVTRVTASAEESDETATEGNAPDIDLSLKCTDMEIISGAGKSAASMLYGD